MDRVFIRLIKSGHCKLRELASASGAGSGSQHNPVESSSNSAASLSSSPGDLSSSKVNITFRREDILRINKFYHERQTLVQKTEGIGTAVDELCYNFLKLTFSTYVVLCVLPVLAILDSNQVFGVSCVFTVLYWVLMIVIFTNGIMKMKRLKLRLKMYQGMKMVFLEMIELFRSEIKQVDSNNVDQTNIPIIDDELSRLEGLASPFKNKDLSFSYMILIIVLSFCLGCVIPGFSLFTFEGSSLLSI